MASCDDQHKQVIFVDAIALIATEDRTVWLFDSVFVVDNQSIQSIGTFKAFELLWSDGNHTFIKHLGLTCAHTNQTLAFKLVAKFL